MVGASGGHDQNKTGADEGQAFHLAPPFCSCGSFNVSATFRSSSLSASREVAAVPVARKCLISTGSPNPMFALNTVYKLINSLGSVMMVMTLPLSPLVAVTDTGGDCFFPF